MLDSSEFALRNCIATVLKKNEVDYLQFTAGRYKRTVTMLTDVTQEAKGVLAR